MFKKALSTSILGLGLMVGGNANALVHDWNGAAAGGVVSSSTWDWFPGNALFVDLIPIPTDPGTIDGTLYIQGHLEGQFGHVGSEVGNGFGWTYQATIPITAQVSATAGGFDFAIFAVNGGTFDIWYDVSVSAFSTVLGTGYADGTNILSAAVQAGVIGNLNISTSLTDGQGSGNTLLDQFGGDNQNGVTTNAVSGGLTIGLETVFEHLDFFGLQSTVNAAGTDLTFTTDFAAEFRNTNPSDLVVGQTPDYDGAGISGRNDNACTSAATCDLHAESDARTPLPPSIPEPTTLALLGLGLAGLGIRKRNRSA